MRCKNEQTPRSISFQNTFVIWLLSSDRQHLSCCVHYVTRASDSANNIKRRSHSVRTASEFSRASRWKTKGRCSGRIYVLRLQRYVCPMWTDAERPRVLYILYYCTVIRTGRPPLLTLGTSAFRRKFIGGWPHSVLRRHDGHRAYPSYRPFSCRWLTVVSNAICTGPVMYRYPSVHIVGRLIVVWKRTISTIHSCVAPKVTGKDLSAESGSVTSVNAYNSRYI